MPRFSISTIAMLGLTAGVFSGCIKKSPLSVDNNSVVTKPFGLFVGDSSGNIWNTNDGITYRPLNATASGGGIPIRCIATSGSNLLYVATQTHLKAINENNFNPVQPNVNPSLYGPFIFDAPEYHKLFMANNTGGVLYNDSNGKKDYWLNDGSITGTITSFTRLGDGTLVAFDDGGKKVFTLANATSGWAPASGSIAGTGTYFITHVNNTIVAADRNGSGIYYSDDKGSTWNSYDISALKGKHIHSMCGAYNQALLVGTEYGGIFKLTLGSSAKLEEANYGMATNAIVTGIVEKYNLYKNGAVKQYVYAATNNGLFYTEDLGVTWVECKAPAPYKNFTAIY